MKKPNYVYVVATGGCRFAVESEKPMKYHNVFAKALRRFAAVGCDLGIVTEITECSDYADASDPYYYLTETLLRKIGKFKEA